jgi:CO/xanthine dehydrogenase Mo-binding subunit
MKTRILCDTGAYASYGLAVASRAPVHATGPYEVEHFEADCLCVYTNNPFGGAMRGFGVPQVAFAHESQMDLLAGALGMDPLEIRRINCLKEGSRTGTGQELKTSVGIGECLEAVETQYHWAVDHWRSAGGNPFIRRGVGLGAMFYGIGNTGVKNPSTARMTLNEDGTITLLTGCADIGQGSTTVFAQIASEELRIPMAFIKVIAADTKYTTNAGATSASRQTYISGNAVREAAGNLRELLIAQGADLLKSPAGSLILDSGFVRETGVEGGKVSFSEIAKEAKRNGASLVFEGAFDPATVPLDPETGQGVPYATYAFACHVALVEADVATGEVRVEKIIAAHDVGKAIYPESVRGQIYGGVAMGVGFALMEEYVPGETESMNDYHIPTCTDMPKVEAILVECPEPTGPFGAKGVGEPALIPTAPAILNALSNAMGERIYSLPASLERVLEAGKRERRFILTEATK